MGQRMPEATLLVGDAEAVLRTLPEKSVHCVVTSPPYYRLRDYHVEGQIGLEDLHDCLGWATGNPCGQCYICKIVAVFREVWRVMRDDATLWLNIGDTFSNVGKNGGHSFGKNTTSANGGYQTVRNLKKSGGGKAKDMLGIPFRAALALQADGWYLRSDIIWSKLNPMPENVTDRPTRSHDYLFLLTKSPKYFYDPEAVKEPATGGTHSRGTKLSPPKESANTADGNGHKNWTSFTPNMVAFRNKRSVWPIASEAFTSGHFATYPCKLVEPCILAGTSARGVCPTCYTPWKRVFIRRPLAEPPQNYHGSLLKEGRKVRIRPDTGMGNRYEQFAVGWRPGCNCYEAPAWQSDLDADQLAPLLKSYKSFPTVPATVLDPFNGAATTGKVALEHGRNYIGIDLNPEYIEISRNRLASTNFGIAGLA